MRKIRTEKFAQYLQNRDQWMSNYPSYQGEFKRKQKDQNVFDESMNQPSLPVGRGKILNKQDREDMAHQDVQDFRQQEIRDRHNQISPPSDEPGHRPGKYEASQGKMDDEYMRADVRSTLGGDVPEEVVDVFHEYMKDKKQNNIAQNSAYAGWDYSNVNHSGEQAHVDKQRNVLNDKVNLGLKELVERGIIQNEQVAPMRERVDQLFEDKYYLRMGG